MSVGIFSPPSSPARPVYPEDSVGSKFKKLLEVVIQAAVRILSIVGIVSMSAASIPLSLHVYGIPLAFVGATFLSAFFFPLPRGVIGRPFFSVPLLSFVPRLGADVPRGLLNAGANCAFNALTHFLLSDPELTRWLKNPLNDQTELENLMNYIGEYPVPIGVIQGFRAYVQRQEGPQLPCVRMFDQFLKNYLPPQAKPGSPLAPLRSQIIDFQDTYHKLRILQQPVADFLVQYDHPQGRPNSQTLRTAFHLCSDLISPSSYVQIDVSEALTILTSILPPRMKINAETRHYLNTANPQQPKPQEEQTVIQHNDGYWTLEFPERGGQRVSLADRLHHYQNDLSNHSSRRKGVNNIERDYCVFRTTVKCISPPLSICFQMKRFATREKYIPPVPRSWLSSWFPQIFPKLSITLASNELQDMRNGKDSQGGMHVLCYEKIDVPVECPEELTIQSIDGTQHIYRLNGFVEHQGLNMESGHYISGRIINNKKYLINDSTVTEVFSPEEQQQWDRSLKQSYLLRYQHVVDQPPHVVVG